MKNFLFVVTLVFVLISCVNEELAISPQGQYSKLSSSPAQDVSTYSAPGGGSTAWITYTNGHYVTSFGGGIDFGTSFPHPVTGGDGEPVTIPYGAIYPGGDAIVDTQGANLIVILQNPRKYGSGEMYLSLETTEVSFGLNGIAHIITTGEFDIEISDNSGFQNPASAGIVVTDHTSPTYMSVVPEGYTVNTSPSHPSTLMELGILTNNGVSYDLYSYSPLSSSGSIVKVISENSSVTVSPSSLTYKRSTDGTHFLIQGTLVTNAGTYSVNATIEGGI